MVFPSLSLAFFRVLPSGFSTCHAQLYLISQLKDSLLPAIPRAIDLRKCRHMAFGAATLSAICPWPQDIRGLTRGQPRTLSAEVP